MPVRRPGGRVQPGHIMFLVTGAALHRIHALPVGSAPDMHDVRVLIVSLPRKVARQWQFMQRG